jgi:[acyl-carrier-protein] S-malonyltransferase
MAKLMAMFPGQGSQYVGMGKQLLAEFPFAKQVFEEAEEAISVDIRKLCFDGPESELMLTANTQPCILAHSVALWTVLREEAGIEPQGFAGHSLGEYSAIVAAGVLGLADGSRLVRRRGEAMQSAVAPGVGAMAAIINADVAELESICKEQSTAESVVEPVNYNSPQQVVIAGHKGAVDKVCQILDEKGVKCVPLQVSAPFHSSLMTKAKEVMTPLLEEVNYKKPSAPVFPNIDAVATGSYGASYLIDQIDHAVRWTQTMQNAAEGGFEHFVEIGPGKVLFGLARRGLPRGLKLTVGENVKDAIEKIKESQ